MQYELFNLIVLGILLGLGVAQLLSLKQDNKHVAVRCEVDMSLTEPDEVFSLIYRVRNTGIWPLFSISLSFALDEGLELRESEEWKAVHCTKNTFLKMTRFKVSLMPRRAIRGRIHLSARERGVYSLGKLYVETGDFLGFRSAVRTIDIPGKVVCTARRLPEEPAIQPFGGFLGDVSARRFILEDPSLVLGFRAYTGSEPMKRISWTQTARTGQLMVKNLDFTVDADVAVLVDEESCPESTREYCLSMLRTVCDKLEASRIPYAVISNGDLSEMKKGVGRKHNFEIQRRIGLSRFTRYRRIEELTEQYAAGELIPRGWIVIAPRADEALHTAVARLRAYTGGQVCLLTGEEAARNA